MIACIDVGTSMIKGGIFDRQGRLASQSQCPVSFLASSESGTYEIDPGDWIEALKGVFESLVFERREVEAIVVSGNGPTLLPVDTAGRVLHPAIMWLDRRGIKEAGALVESAGLSVDASFFLSKAYWFYRFRPDIYEKTRFFLACPEYVNFYLCGESSTILPSPRFEQYVWNAEAIKALGMDRKRFPPFVKPGTEIGRLRADAAQTLGLEQSTRVIAGGPDYVMSLLGTGTIEPGLSCDRAGTSEGINFCSTVPVRDRRLISLPHILDDLHNIAGVISTTGKALEWYQGLSGLSRRSFMRSVQSTPAGSRGIIFLPYLTGERSPVWDPEARGAFVGLTLGHGVDELARAVAESIGFAIRDVLEVMRENNLVMQEIRVAGSQSQIEVLNQIKADISGKRLLIPAVAESELMGDACIGLVALGEFESLQAACRECVKIEREFNPNSRNLALYTEMFYLYRDIYSGLKGTFHKLAGGTELGETSKDQQDASKGQQDAGTGREDA